MSDMWQDSGPGFTVEAAHANDQLKEVVYPPMPPREAPDFAALRRRALNASEEARVHLGDE